MTSELRQRPPRSPGEADGALDEGHGPWDERPRGGPGTRSATFGAPRRTRASLRGWAAAILIAVPVGVMAAVGATVIDGYHDNTRAADTRAADSRGDVAPAPEASVDPQDAELLDHAPNGQDVGVQGLTDQMVRAITRARAAAAEDGIPQILIVSGYRTKQTQQRLYDEAIVKYGTAAEASKWVLPPDKSEHVNGAAIDVSPYAAAKWLEKNGVSFGLCRRYANEYWHFELLAMAKGSKCPAMEADASG